MAENFVRRVPHGDEITLRSGKLMIKKNANGYTTLVECDHETEPCRSCRFVIRSV